MTVSQETVIYADPKKFGVEASPAKVIAIKVGESGYYPIYGKFSANDLNTDDVTPEIVDSAVAGSMFGWNTPAAQLAVQFASGE